MAPLPVRRSDSSCIVHSGRSQGVPALFAAVPVPGTPPGTDLPGVQAAAAICRDGRIVAITRLANAVPGRPDGEVDTRPLVPLWQQPFAQDRIEPWDNPWE